jgi:carboxyl-terminal processing protease
VRHRVPPPPPVAFLIPAAAALSIALCAVLLGVYGTTLRPSRPPGGEAERDATAEPAAPAAAAQEGAPSREAAATAPGPGRGDGRPTSFLDSARQALDARAVIRFLHMMVAGTHPSLAGVTREEFDARVLAALARLLEREPERARLAKVDPAEIDRLAAGSGDEFERQVDELLIQGVLDAADVEVLAPPEPEVAPAEEEPDSEAGAEGGTGIEAREGVAESAPGRTPARSVMSLARAWLPEGAGTVEPEIAERVDLLEDAIVEAVEDPFTQVIRGAELLDMMLMELLQIPSQIGVLALPAADGGFEIGVVLRDTDAAAKGIRAGDRLLSVGGEPVRGLPRDVVQAKIARPCRLELSREGLPASFVLDVRAAAPLNAPSIAARIDADVGYLAFPLFRAGAFAELFALGRRLEREGARAWVLDLRGNPGGLLAEAGAVASLFLAEGLRVGDLEMHGPLAGLPGELVSGRPAFPDAPLAVLVDRSSASASEVLAAALDDHHRALLVGARTFGKGVGQSVFAMPILGQDVGRAVPRLDMFVITVMALRSPRGRDWHHMGLEPDVRVSAPHESVERIVRRAALLDREGLVAEVAALELTEREVEELRAPGPAAPAAALRAAERAGLAARSPEEIEALKDVVRMAQRGRHPQLHACPALDPALAKALAAVRLELKRRAAPR